MQSFDRDRWAELVRHEEHPSVTVQMPVHREAIASGTWPAKVSAAHDELSSELAARGVDQATREALLEPLSRWTEERPGVPRRGMTLLATLSPSKSQVFRLEALLSPLAVVSDHFALSEALASLLTEPPVWAVLGLSDEGARLVRIEGGRWRKVDLPLDRADREAANRERVEPTPGGSVHRHSLGRYASNNLQPQGFGTEDPDSVEREIWYRTVVRALEESGEVSEIPLVLLAKELHHAGFRAVARQRELLQTLVDHSPQPLSDQDLIEAARPVVQRLARPDVETAATQWANALRDGRIASTAEAIVQAADHGRVDRVFWAPRSLSDDQTSFDLVLDAAIARSARQGSFLLPMAEDALPGPRDHRINAILRW